MISAIHLRDVSKNNNIPTQRRDQYLHMNKDNIKLLKNSLADIIISAKWILFFQQTLSRATTHYVKISFLFHFHQNSPCLPPTLRDSHVVVLFKRVLILIFELCHFQHQSCSFIYHTSCKLAFIIEYFPNPILRQKQLPLYLLIGVLIRYQCFVTMALDTFRHKASILPSW